MKSTTAAGIDTRDESSGALAVAPSGTSDYVRRNKAAWERWAPQYAERARAEWRDTELRWGIWGIPEAELGLLAELEPGAKVIELGCGAGALSAGLVRRGFNPEGVDFVRAQLETAAELEREFGLWFPLLCANTEKLHHGKGSFDCVVSEYGASLWCNPHRWLSEAYRLLRPGGWLIFITSSALLMTCTPNDGSLVRDRLARDYFSRFSIEFPGDDGAVEFHLTHGHWVRVLRKTGFVLQDLIETRPPEGAKPRFGFVSLEWARRWPSEDIWIARKTR